MPGGSGCGCCATMLCGYFLPKLRKGEWRELLFCATGALMSPTSVQQGQSIPGIAHALRISSTPAPTGGNKEEWENGMALDVWEGLCGRGGCSVSSGSCLLTRPSSPPPGSWCPMWWQGYSSPPWASTAPWWNLPGAGASVPLTGFGYLLATGVKEAVASDGLFGRPAGRPYRRLCRNCRRHVLWYADGGALPPQRQKLKKPERFPVPAFSAGYQGQQGQHPLHHKHHSRRPQGHGEQALPLKGQEEAAANPNTPEARVAVEVKISGTVMAANTP